MNLRLGVGIHTAMLPQPPTDRLLCRVEHSRGIGDPEAGADKGERQAGGAAERERSAPWAADGDNRPVHPRAEIVADALDPEVKESPGWAALQQCRAYMALGRYSEAVASCEKDVALDKRWLPHAYLVAAYAQNGEATRAAAEKTALLKLRPEFSIADFKAQRFSDHPAFLLQTETHLYAGLRKAGIAES